MDKGTPMEDFADRYGSHFMKLVDSCASGKEFEFDQALLMPTAAGYRALVEQARVEIKPRIMTYLTRKMVGGSHRELILLCHGSSRLCPEHLRSAT